MRTILHIVRKETLQVLRDRIMLIQIFIPPVLQLLILVHAMTFEVKDTRLAVVDLDRSPASGRLIQRFTASGRFEIAVMTASGDRADEALLSREADAVLRIPGGFARNLRQGRAATVQVILNAEDGAAAGVLQSYAAQIIARFSQEDAGEMRAASGPGVAASGPRVSIQTRTFYNPEREYLGTMAIGLLAMLVTIIAVLLTAQNIAREKEIGTLEQLNVTPITRSQFILGKLIPFWALGLIELSIGLMLIRFVFGIPFEGSVLLVYLSAAVYLLGALGLGLLISTVAETQQQAMFVTFFTLITCIFLSGLFTPVQSMPEWVRIVAELNPIKHFIYIVRSVLMKGATLGEVSRAIGALAAFAAVVLPLAVLRYRKTAA